MSVLRVPTLQKPLVFVDIETNGLSHIHGRVIEVAAIRVENGLVVQSFQSLINPETRLPQYITNLTGINEGDVAGAPTFDRIADELSEILKGAIFVAHNVRFDYSFLKQEFARIGQTFLPKQLCTVKLSRTLHPHERGHKLEDLIRRHGFTVSKRHRAYDDAAVLWQFMQYLSTNFPPEQIETAIAKQIRQPAIPKSLHPDIIKTLPETPGVYIFEDAIGQPLYVGKSINIKKRVLSHFGRDHAENKEFKIAQSVHAISTQTTSGELAALLLESQLVKDLQPVYNRRLRRTKKLVLLRESTDANGYSIVGFDEALEIEPAEIGAILAVYTHRGKARDALENLRKLYDLCPKLLGLEKTNGACFLYQLKKCRGACIGAEEPAAYNARIKIAFDRKRLQAWPYNGPVILQETEVTDPTASHAFIINQWCVIGEIEQAEDCDPVIATRKQSFDLDTYKILRSYMSDKLHKLRIRMISQEQLHSLLSV